MTPDQPTHRLTKSDLPLAAQVSILLAALDHIAAWDDGDLPDEPGSARRARRALDAAGFRYIAGDAHPLVVEQHEQAARIVSRWHFPDAVAPAGSAKTARLPSRQ
jgi:hypothetical protein